MSRIRGIAVATALLTTIASTLSAYPHQLAYFNEVSGGPSRGAFHLSRSSTDWGQDILLVREWIDAEAEVLPIRTALSAPLGTRAPIDLAFPGIPLADSGRKAMAQHMEPGTYIISNTYLYHPMGVYWSFLHTSPTTTIGHTHSVYVILRTSE